MKYITPILAVISAVFWGLLQREKKEQAQGKVEREETAREYENAGSEALINGLEKEQQVNNETIDTSKRDHFN